MRIRKVIRKLRTPLRVWPRFSLLTMFLVAIFLSLVFSNLYISWQLGKTHVDNRAQKALIQAQEKELRRYRNQLGVLTTQDPTKVHIIALDTYQDKVWKYRIFVPTGKEFAVKSVVGNVPLDHLPPEKKFNVIGPGKWTLSFSLTQRTDGKWVERIDRVLEATRHEFFSKIHDSDVDWQQITVTGERQILTPLDGQRTYLGDTPIELVRISKPPSRRQLKKDPQAPNLGLIFWLEPK